MTKTALKDFGEKKKRLRGYMQENGYGAAILSRRDMFAWLSCGGDSKILRNTEIGVGAFLVTRDEIFLISETMNIDFLMDDFLTGTDILPVPTKWHDPPEIAVAVKMAGNAAIVSDREHPGCEYKLHELQMLQFPLTDLEVETCVENCGIINRMLKDIADYAKPGMTEREIEAEVIYGYTKNGFDCQVILIGSDWRISKYRHPIASGKAIEKTLLIHPASSRKGLFANITRMVSFGEPDRETVRRYDAVCRLEAQTLSMTRPGVRLHSVLEKRKKLYADLGFAEEYENHYPGTVTGYFVASATPVSENERIMENQLLDWFITITGVKTEELTLSGGGGGILLSSGADNPWPTEKYSYEENTYDLPAIYIR